MPLSFEWQSADCEEANKIIYFTMKILKCHVIYDFKRTFT